jgi:uncharacterized membrane protein
MSAAFAPSPWPAPAVAGAALRPLNGWRFAREVQFGAAQHTLQWVLRRNCALSPRQLLAAYGLLCTISLTIASGFWLAGATAVLAFAGLELLAVGLALLVFARHAGDRETITLDGRELAVEHQCGSSVQRATFRSAWVRVEPQAAQGSLVELSGDGARTCVGRYLPAALRADLAQELRAALRGRRAGL